MHIYELPTEIQIKIYSYLNFKDIRSLALSNPIIFNLIKNLFFDKEDWIILNNIENISIIEKLINLGYRHINLNGRNEVIYNYFSCGSNNEISQIITNKDLYGVNFRHSKNYSERKDHLIFPNGRNCKKNITKILISAPYEFKRKGICK